jgi:hypothetical protein
MAISMYRISVPVFIRFLENLERVLEKGEAFAKERGINPAVLIGSRLAPDMFPQSKQVEITCDLGRECIERLAGLESAGVDDIKKTFSGFHDRINDTIAFLKSIRPEQLEGTADKTFTLEIRGYRFDFNGVDLVLYFYHPNMYFHVTTAYDILRHNGVELGKKDFIGKYPV